MTTPQEQLVNKENIQPQCHIHDRVSGLMGEDIHQKVCVPESDYPLTEFEGKVYCLFHLPTKEKDIERFEQIFRARLERVEKELAKIENLPQHNRQEARSSIKYDFSYVWFPCAIDLSEYKFSSSVRFYWATFSDKAAFREAVFLYSADFSSTTFLAYADFNWATIRLQADFELAAFSDKVEFYQATLDIPSFNRTIFSARAYFRGAIFSRAAHFYGANFLAEANFYEANFLAEVFFSKATFWGKADFRRAKFNNSHKTLFEEATFSKDTFFDRARLKNDLSFDYTIFGIDSKVSFHQTFFAKRVCFNHSTVEGSIQFSNLRQGKENKFDFQETVFEKANRVLFNAVRLRPSWFVNVHLQEFIFTAIHWEHIKPTQENILIEVNSLWESKINEPERMLEIACRNLAQNTRKNLSYIEATNFLQMADQIKQLRLEQEANYLTKNQDQNYSNFPTNLIFNYPVFIFNNQSYKGSKAFLSTLIITLFRVLLAIFVFTALQSIDFSNNLQLKFGLNTLFFIYFVTEILEFFAKARFIKLGSRLFKKL
jgi:hypothetical protein